MISLFGMILVVGILVDDGIVIAENIYSHYKMGKKSITTLDGNRYYTRIYFCFNNCVCFFYFLFVGGEMQMMQEMACYSCSFVLIIEAFLILRIYQQKII